MSDTESAFEELHDNDIPVQEVPDSHDLRLARVRQVVGNPETNLAPEVRVAANLVRSLATWLVRCPMAACCQVPSEGNDGHPSMSH